MLLSLSAAGLNQRGLREGFPGIAFRLGFGFLIGALVMTLNFNVLPEADIGLQGLQVALGTALIAVCASRLIFYSLTDQGALRRLSKRTADLTMSLLLLIVTLPLMLLAALGIWLELGGRGPILYRQVRVGRDGRHFEILKFRSMRPDHTGRAVEQGSTVAGV